MALPPTLRTFIAIPLPDVIISQLLRVQQRLQHKCPDRCIRWVNPHTIHLTLYFIGDMPTTQVENINQALQLTVEPFSMFEFAVENIGTFPNATRPNVIWVGVADKEHRLADLYAAVSAGMARLGFTQEKRKFTPHLTIGRVNRRTTRDDRAVIGSEVAQNRVGLLGTVQVSEVVFYRSILKHTGAEHIPLARFPFIDPA